MAHCNTIFHQMLKLIPRHHFGKLETEHGTGRKARSFTRWSQLVHLVFIQLTARASLRDGVASLKARFKNLYHLGRDLWPDPPLPTPIIGGPPRFLKPCSA